VARSITIGARGLLASPPSGAFPAGGFAGVEHIHPHQHEHFEVVAGQAAFSIEGVERVLGAG